MSLFRGFRLMRPRKSLLEGLGVRRMPRQTLPHRRTERGFKSRTCALSESKSGLYDAKSVRQEAKAARLDQRAFALKLYRAILMTHRRVLPPDMAEFGNMYLRDEWKKHKDADIEHLGGFFEQWMQYLQNMIQNSGGDAIAKGQVNTLGELSGEQLDQLEKLREAVIEDFAGDSAADVDGTESSENDGAEGRSS